MRAGLTLNRLFKLDSVTLVTRQAGAAVAGSPLDARWGGSSGSGSRACVSTPTHQGGQRRRFITQDILLKHRKPVLGREVGVGRGESEVEAAKSRRCYDAPSLKLTSHRGNNTKT